MTKAEKIEFTSLKYARAEQGFFTPEQKVRWDVLLSLHRSILKKRLQDFDKWLDEVRLSKLN